LLFCILAAVVALCGCGTEKPEDAAANVTEVAADDIADKVRKDTAEDLRSE